MKTFEVVQKALNLFAKSNSIIISTILVFASENPNTKPTLR